MLSWLDPLRGVDTAAVVVKMALACLCGALIGLERSAKNRPAGFRTHTLVCLAACIAMTSGLYLYLGMELPSDISRIGAQVISGLGFIGAGTIVITKKTAIKGLTTAAGLWTTGIIGLCVGTGYYELAVIGTALVLLTETVFLKLGMRIRQLPIYTLLVRYREKTALDRVLRRCKDRHMSIVRLKINTPLDDDTLYQAQIILKGRVTQDVMEGEIRSMKDIISVEQA